MPLQSLHPSEPRTGCCPHLGIPDDPATCLNYPSEWNLCYHAWPVGPVNLEHQRKVCLSPVFSKCPVYAREHRAPLPRSLRLARAINWLRLALLTALLLVVAISLWSAWREGRWPFPLDQLIRFQGGLFFIVSRQAYICHKSSENGVQTGRMPRYNPFSGHF